MSTNDKKIKYEKLTESDYDTAKSFKYFIDLEKHAKNIVNILGYDSSGITKETVEYWFDFLIDSKLIINNKSFKNFQKGIKNNEKSIKKIKKILKINNNIENDTSSSLTKNSQEMRGGAGVIVIIIVVIVVILFLIQQFIYDKIYRPIKEFKKRAINSLVSSLRLMIKQNLLNTSVLLSNNVFNINDVKPVNYKDFQNQKNKDDQTGGVKSNTEGDATGKLVVATPANLNNKNVVKAKIEVPTGEPTGEQVELASQLSKQETLIKIALEEMSKPRNLSIMNKIIKKVGNKKYFKQQFKIIDFKKRSFSKINDVILKKFKVVQADLPDYNSNSQENKINTQDEKLKTFFIEILQQISTSDKLKKNVKGIYGSKGDNGTNLINLYRKNDSDFFKLFIFDLFEGSVVDAIIYELNISLLFLANAIEKRQGKLKDSDIEKLTKFNIKQIQNNILIIVKQKIKNWFTTDQINIDEEKFKKLIIKFVKKVVQQILIFIDGLQSETLLADIFGVKKDKDICDIIPFFVFAGIPYKINQKIKEGIKTLREYNAITTSNNVKNLKRMLCLTLVEGIITDFLTPFKKIMKILLSDVLIKKIDLEICSQESNNDEEKCSLEHKEKTPEELKKLIGEAINLKPKSGGGLVGGLVGGAVIGEGSYGCVFKPPIGCDGNEQLDIENSQYVSKLMIDYKWKIKREFEISNIIKTIPNYENSFGPLLSLCFIDVAKLNVSKENKDNCSLIKDKKSTKYVSALSKIKYIDLYHFDEIISIHTPKVNLMYFIKIYQSLLKSISALIKRRIVHYDLHSGNIVFDKKSDRPMIIDFGMAFKVDKMKKIDKIFFKDALEWTAWPLEAHFIGFILNLKRKLTDDEVVKIVDTFVEKHKIFTLYKNKISSKKIRLFKEKSLTYLRKLNKLPVRECVKKVIVTSWKTWDNYSISILFLKYLFYLKPTNILSKTFIKRFFNILFKNISPDVSKRSSVKKTYEKFKKLLNSQNFNNNFNRNVNIKAFDAFKRNIIKQHNEDISISQHIKNNI